MEDNSIKVGGVPIGGCCYLTSFNLMDNSPQLVDTGQHIVSDGHPNVVSRSLKRSHKMTHSEGLCDSTSLLAVRNTHVLVAQVENKQVGVLIVALLSSPVSPGGMGLMAIQKKIDSCERFYVFKVLRWMKLNMILSIERSGNRKLWGFRKK